MKRPDALPGYIAITLAVLFPAYWIPTLSFDAATLAEAYRADVMRLSAMDLLFVLIGAIGLGKRRRANRQRRHPVSGEQQRQGDGDVAR